MKEMNKFQWMLTVICLTFVLFSPICQGILYLDGPGNVIDYEVNETIVVGPRASLDVLEGADLIDGIMNHGILNVSGGTVSNFCHSADSGVTNIYGGNFPATVSAHDGATVNISDGIFSKIQIAFHATSTISGGTITDILEVYGEGNGFNSVTIRGGIFDCDMHVMFNSQVTIIGSGFNYDYGEIPVKSGILTGTLASGEALNVAFDFDERTDVEPKIILEAVPEPGTILLLGFGGILVRRRRR